MTQTANDICRQALREIEVLGIGQDMAAEDYDHAKEKLDQLYAELTYPPHSIPIPWTIAGGIPDNVATALAQALAEDIGRPYGRQFVRVKRDEAMARLMAMLLPDDRVDNVAENVINRAKFY